jgi:hypothetical protein
VAQFFTLGVIRNMKLNGHSYLCICLLIILSMNGCTTYRREAFLKSHSLDRFMVDRPQPSPYALLGLALVALVARGGYVRKRKAAIA